MTDFMEEKFSESDRHYISLLEECINRMAANSANCKTWLVSLVAAILALQLTGPELRSILWVALGLIVIFFILDSYYLSLERKFIVVVKNFVSAVQDKNDEHLSTGIYSFNIKSVTDKRATVYSAFFSLSTLPFYLTLFLIVLGVCLWPLIF